MENNLLFLEDLGMRFPTEESKRKYRYGLYKCYCGNTFEAIISDVKRGRRKSCGCLRPTNKFSSHRLYGVWRQMVQRCTNSSHVNYKNYGGRGITVCDAWLDIENFVDDMYPSFKEGLTLDREDNGKGYSKDNCRWVTVEVQARNTRQLRKNNTSNYRGVSWHKGKGKWTAYININRKRHYLGYFDTAKDAGIAYNKYVIEHNLEHTLNIVVNYEND